MWDGINTDAATIAKICKPGDLIAYYIDGKYAWTAQEIALFSGHPMVTITCTGSHAADVGDVETGDMTPSGGASWVEDRIKAGYARPSLYTSLSVVENIRIATGANILQKNYDLWVADYDNKTASVYVGSAAKQFKNTAYYDESEVYDDLWPHRTVVGAVTTVASRPKWPLGQLLVLGNKGNAVQAMQEGLSWSGLHTIGGIATDGVFGTKTEASVRAYQAYAGISVDGKPGNQTRASMIGKKLLNSAGQAID
jgi:hypothetical protein